MYRPLRRKVRSRFGFGSRSILLIFALWLIGCFTVPETGRRHLVLIPESQVNELGASSYQELLGKADVSRGGQQVEMVRRVGQRIAAVADRRMLEQNREIYQWEFNVIDSPQVNAFALPGGKVAFYTGILPICESETGVAVVMGHEIAHAYAQHGRTRLSTDLVAKFGFTALQLALGATEEGKEGGDDKQGTRLLLGALGAGYTLGVALPFGRDHELEADEIGLLYMAEAGYDPRESVRFWSRMKARSGGNAPPEFLSTHPGHDTRIQRLREIMPRALEIYQRSRGVARGRRE